MSRVDNQICIKTKCYKSSSFQSEAERNELIYVVNNKIKEDLLTFDKIKKESLKELDTFGIYTITLKGEESTDSYIVVNKAKDLSELTLEKIIVYKKKDYENYKKLEPSELNAFRIDNVRLGKVLSVKYSNTMGLGQLLFVEDKKTSMVVSNGCLGRQGNVVCATIFQKSK